jgi:hypothetical protein
MIIECQHLYCAKCVRVLAAKENDNCYPLDGYSISMSQLIQPIRLVKTLLNELKTRCDFEGYQQTVSLGNFRIIAQNVNKIQKLK